MSSLKPENLKRTLELALEVSLITGDMKMLEQAFNKGADAQTALVYGHRNKDWKVIDAALKAGADINASVDGSANGDTFLISAIKASDYGNRVKGYLDRGADPNLTFGAKSAAEIALEYLKQCHANSWSTDTIKPVVARMLDALPDKNAAAAPTLSPVQKPATIDKPVVVKPLDVRQSQ